MRWFVLVTACLLAGWVPAGETVRADEIDPTLRAEQPAAAKSISAVRVRPFEVSSEAVPQWLGRSFQRSVQEELKSVSGVELVGEDAAATQPSRPAEYTVTGRCAGTEFLMEVSLAVRHVGSDTVVQSVTVRGQPSDVLQMKAALRQQVRKLFSPEQTQRGSPTPQREVQTNTVSAIQQETPPGSQYAGSALEWAIENPDAYRRELEFYRSRSTSAYLGNGWGYGYGMYGWGFPYGDHTIVRPPYACAPGPIFKFNGAYRSGGWWLYSD